MKLYEYTGPWPWPHFRPAEVACRCCGELWPAEKGQALPDYLADALDALEALRDAWGKPIVLTSGHRCQRHNAEVGGTEGSQHLRIAFDCIVPAERQADFVTMAMTAGFTGVGRYPNRGFVHLDLGLKRTWRG